MGFSSSSLVHHFIWEFDYVKENPYHMFEALFEGTGRSNLGAPIGFLAGLFIYCRMLKLDFFHFSFPSLKASFLWLGIGRIACFLNGDAYGIPTSSFLGVTFSEDSSDLMSEWKLLSSGYSFSPNPLPEIEKIFTAQYGLHLSDLPIPDKLSNLKMTGYSTLADLNSFYKNSSCIKTLAEQGLWPFPTVYPKVHPTQLYELFSLVGIYFFFEYFYGKRWRESTIPFLYIIIFGKNRFWIEFFRADRSPGFFGLTGAQILCLGYTLSGICMYFYYTEKWKKDGIPL
ncbi:MAG TPA: prolipoprotein diacylglyceryl transferase [Leptospiraceae bacterium]|nr:prolipoprotein diacylglyceryl transferase [Leptospiraceae bacterium]